MVSECLDGCRLLCCGIEQGLLRRLETEALPPVSWKPLLSDQELGVGVNCRGFCVGVDV